MDSTATPKEDAVEEKHDPFSNLKIHSNLELYFRERVFCSKTKRSERVTHLTVIMVAVINPTIGSSLASTANSTKSTKKKKNIEGNDIECVVVLTDESLYIMRTLEDKTLQFKDEANFEQIGVYNFKAIKQVVIGFWAQRLVLKTVDGMCFVLLTPKSGQNVRHTAKVTEPFRDYQRRSEYAGVITEEYSKRSKCKHNPVSDAAPKAQGQKTSHAPYFSINQLRIYLCEEDYANEWVSEEKKPGGEVSRIRLERYSTIKDIIKLEPSERPTDFTIVVSEMMGILPRQRRWRLRVDSRAKKAKVLQELENLFERTSEYRFYCLRPRHDRLTNIVCAYNDNDNDDEE